MNLLKKKKSGTSLFKQKNTPEFLTNQTKVRNSLLKSLSRAIKEVQLQFANQDPQTEDSGSIGDCRGAQHVCSAFEEILKHGLKPNWFGQGSATFWPIVRKISRKQAIECVDGLQHAQSDSAKCRGWIRMAVNECSLESYIHVLCRDASLLSHYYENHSFLRDPESVSALTQMLTGLTQITFKLTVDVASLEFDSVPEVHSDVPLRMNPAPRAKVSPASRRRKPKRSKQSTVNSTTDTTDTTDTTSIDNISTASSSCVSLDSIPTESGSVEPNCNGTGTDSEGPLEERTLTSDGLWTGGGVLDGVWTGGGGLEGDVDMWADSGHVHAEKAEGGLLTGGEEVSAEGVAGGDVWADSDHLTVEGGDWEAEREGQRSEDSRLDNGGSIEGGEEHDESSIDGDEWDIERSRMLQGGVVSPEGGGVITADQQERVQDSGSDAVQDRQEKERQGTLMMADVQDTQEGVKRQDTLVAHDLQDRGHERVESENGDQLQDRHGLQDMLVAGDLQDRHRLQGALDDLQDSKERQDTLVAVNEPAAVSPQRVSPSPATPLSHTPPATPPHLPTPFAAPLSSTNPFLSGTPPPLQGALNLNPFIAAPSANPFEESPDEAEPISPLNPFSTDWPHLSTNPFDRDDHAHTLSEPRPHPSPPPPVSRSPKGFGDEDLPYSSLPSDPPSDPPANFNHRTTTAHSKPPANSGPLQSNPPANYGLLPSVNCDPLSTNLPANSGSLITFPPPPSAPPSGSVPSTASASPNLPQSHTGSASPNPSRSHTSDDLESCSTSSIDVSVFMETTPPDSHLLSPLSVNEDFFAPEMTTVEVQLAIDRLKVDLMKPSLDEEEGQKEQMRHRIVALQMRLRQLRDEEEAVGQLSGDLLKEVYGHQLISQPRHVHVGKRRQCEGCGKRIRGLMRPWYLCKLCGFGYHKKCLPLLDRVCSASRTAQQQQDAETPNFILEVCPEKGLTGQHFRCASCNIAFNSTTIVARLCDYSGLYYCPSCHHNDLAVIPARVVHNWDFVPRKVCCKCCDTLDRHSMKPLLKIRSLNPQLYTYVQDLVTIETLRKDILVMKTYFAHCPQAKELFLLRRLDPFPHFKEGAKRFSLLDLKAVHTGELVKELTAIHRDFIFHIKKECSVCSSRGFSCELCNSGEALYPFDRRCRQCPKCRTIYHKDCYSEMTTCPKCSRTRHHKKRPQ